MALHGRNSCFLNISASSYATTLEYESQNFYVNIFQLLSSLTASGEVERIAYYIGHVNSGALGNGLDFAPSANQSGGNAFSVWRFASSSARPYDYYALFQHAGGSTSAENIGAFSGSYATYDIPLIGTTNRGFVGWQLACSYDTASFIASSPWNGTTNNDGTDVKGTPTWNTGSVGETLVVLPAHNNYRPNKDHLGALYYRGNVGTVYQGVLDLMIETGTENDGLYYTLTRPLQGSPPASTNIFTIEFGGYLGTYVPRSEISGAVVPLIGFGGASTADSLFFESNGTLMKSGSVGIHLSGSESAGLFNIPVSRNTECFTTTKSPFVKNSFLNNAIEKAPLALVASGTSSPEYFGYVGHLSKNIAMAYKPAIPVLGTNGQVAFRDSSSTAAIFMMRSSSFDEPVYLTATCISGSVTY